MQDSSNEEPTIAELESILGSDFGEETATSEKEAAPKVSKPSQGSRNIDMILDIPIMISVELGRAKILFNELLQLGQGSVVELNKLAGEPLDILANKKLVARGEAVVVNDKFGVRLTDILSPVERIKQLKS